MVPDHLRVRRGRSESPAVPGDVTRRLHMHLGDQGQVASRLDSPRASLHGHRFRHSMGGKHHHRAVRNLGKLVDETAPFASAHRRRSDCGRFRAARRPARRAAPADARRSAPRDPLRRRSRARGQDDGKGGQNAVGHGVSFKRRVPACSNPRGRRKPCRTGKVSRSRLPSPPAWDIIWGRFRLQGARR
jgi:hypothetical protein